MTVTQKRASMENVNIQVKSIVIKIQKPKSPTKCLAAKAFCNALTSAWKPEDAIMDLSALRGHINKTAYWFMY